MTQGIILVYFLVYRESLRKCVLPCGRKVNIHTLRLCVATHFEAADLVVHSKNSYHPYYPIFRKFPCILLGPPILPSPFMSFWTDMRQSNEWPSLSSFHVRYLTHCMWTYLPHTRHESQDVTQCKSDRFPVVLIKKWIVWKIMMDNQDTDIQCTSVEAKL